MKNGTDPDPKAVIPDPKAAIPDPTLLQTYDPWSHIPCYYPEIGSEMIFGSDWKKWDPISRNRLTSVLPWLKTGFEFRNSGIDIKVLTKRAIDERSFHLRGARLAHVFHRDYKVYQADFFGCWFEIYQTPLQFGPDLLSCSNEWNRVRWKKIRPDYPETGKHPFFPATKKKDTATRQ